MSEMGRYLSGEVMIQLHHQPDYQSFFLMMEHGVHNAVQVAIGGDILFNTAPYGLCSKLLCRILSHLLTNF